MGILMGISNYMVVPGKACNQFESIYSIRALIIRPGLSRHLEFEKGYKRKEKNKGMKSISKHLL